MPQWEYSKRSLNEAPARTTDVDLLNAAGKDGWELVGITVNNLAYLKRPLPAAAADPPTRPPARRKTAATRESED
jgi:hypothetical protein